MNLYYVVTYNWDHNEYRRFIVTAETRDFAADRAIEQTWPTQRLHKISLIRENVDFEHLQQL